MTTKFSVTLPATGEQTREWPGYIRCGVKYVPFKRRRIRDLEYFFFRPPTKQRTMNKRTFLTLGLLASLAGLSTGCAILHNPTTAQRAATTAKVAAYVGCYEHLQHHPEARLPWTVARDALFQLEGQETVDLVTLMAVVNRLPVKELKSPRAQMVITAATILLTDYVGTIPAEDVGKLKPLVRAIKEGIDLGLGPSAP